MAQEALLIIDMSNDFVHPDGTLTAGEPARQIVPYIVTQAQAMLEKGGSVAVCMDSHAPKDPHFQDWPVHNITGTWGWQLYGDLVKWYKPNSTNPRVTFIPKSQYDAFYNTDLETKLRRQGVDTVHLTGVCTDICVFLTAAGANYRGFKTIVHRLGVATFNPHQETFLKQMELCFHTQIV
ncbi:MAG: cysteine hydrolase [Heliobacteriaceae bacterium]|nr:cysteine hydrolase [Heliobacteriaceae bacterium]MDD4588541.1 cysteine hydrolase [Heliobacteriaceae bacterium]